MSVSRKRDHGQGLAGALPLISAPSAAMSGQRQQQQQQEAQQQRFKDRSMLVNHAEILTFLKSNYKYKRRCRSASGVRLPVEPMPMPQPLPTDGHEGVARAAPATVAARDSAGDSAIVCITDPRGEAKMTATMMEMMARRMTKSDKFSILKLINLSLVVVLTVANVMSRLMTLLLLLLFMLPSTMRPPRQQQNHHHQRQQQEGEEEQEQEQAANRSRAVVAVGRVGDRNRDDGHDVDVNDDVDVDGDEVDDSDVNDDSDETSCQRNHDKLSTLGSRSQPRPLQPQPRRQRCRRPSPRWRRQRHACTRHRWIRVLLPSLSWSASASSSSSSSPTPSPGSSSPADCDNHAPVLPIFMTLFIAMALSVRCAEGGACWQKTLSNGKCSEIYSLNITKDECCAASQDFSFTDRELTSVEYFFATALGGGMECAPCMESCRGVHCGPNKRCAKRKGRPKCICAPECGAATRKRQRGARLLRGAADEHLEAAAVFGKSARDPRSLSAEVRGQHLDGVDGPWRRGRGPDEPVAATQAETAALDRRGRGSAPSSQRQKVVVVQGQRGGRLRGRRMGPGAKAEAEPEARAKASSQGPGQRESPGPQRRLMIVQSRGQHEEKPTTRRLQVISNVNNNNNNQSNSHKRRKGEKMAQKQRQNKESSSSQEVDGRGGRREGEEQEKEEARRGFANAAAATTITQTNTTRKSQSMSRHKQNTSHNNNNNNNNNNDNYNNNKNTSNMQQTKNFDTNNNNSNNHYNNNNNSKLRHIHQSSRQLENTSNHDQQQQPQQQLQQHHGRHHQFRKRKKKLHNKDQQQQQQQQQPAHARADTARPGDVGSNNATAKMTMTTTTVTVSGSGSGSGSSKTTNTKTTTTTIATLGSTPANSAPSEKPSLNRGSDFATSSGTSSSPASSSSSSSPSSLSSPSSPSSSVSGGERSLSSPGSPGESATDEAAAGVAGIRPGGGGGDVASSGAADDVDGRRSFVNADDLAFDDRIYDKFNLHGIPSQQQVVTHLEKTHSSHHPVCGTDGRTYNTECQLKKRACRTDNADLVVAYHGHCRTSCSGVKCLNGLTCVEDQYAIPNCIACQIACPLDDRHEAEGVAVDEARAVCGVDGQTYRSVCAINRMICRIGRSIGVAYPGPCRDDRVTCADIHCGPKRTCLMDLLTHEPRCVSCRYKCSRKRRPGAVRYEEGRICGVNNRTYNSWCEMRKDSCSTGFFIDVKSLGGCQ